LRREELFSLTWFQVDLVRGLITTTTRTKNGRARKVPVPARSAQILGQIKIKLSKNAQYVLINPDIGERYVKIKLSKNAQYVLINPDIGERYVQMNKGLADAVRRANKAELNRLGPNERDALQIKDLRWHDLRRTADCRWLQRDRKSMEEVSILLVPLSQKMSQKVAAAAVRESGSGAIPK
jgi:integrase